MYLVIVLSQASGAVNNDVVDISVSAAVGLNVRQIGSDIQLGELLLSPGETIQPVDVGLLATVGVVSLQVYKKPIIGIMSTGNEFVEPSVVPTGSQIRDSNRPSLLAAFRHDIGRYEVVDLGIVPDVDVMDMQGKLMAAVARCDVVVTTGGVSDSHCDCLCLCLFIVLTHLTRNHSISIFIVSFVLLVFSCYIIRFSLLFLFLVMNAGEYG